MTSVHDQLEVVLYADHNHFSVVDDGDAPLGDEDPEELWNHTALQAHLGVQRGTLLVYTGTYGYVRVVVERVDEPAGLEEFDHVVEAPLDVRSGRVTVLETTNPQGTLTVAPGSYRARIGWRGVADAEHADPERDAPVETVLIQLCPGTLDERRVLRWFPEWEPPQERPTNPYGLRVLVGGECDAVAGGRVVGEPKDAGKFDDRAVVRDDHGTHWLHSYSDRPPYGPVMLELPDAALDEFVVRPQPPPAGSEEEEAARAIALPAEERYRYFVETVARTGWIWTLSDGMSPLEWQDEDTGASTELAWPHPRAAEAYAAEEAPEMRPVDHELEAWLEALERYHEFVMVFPISFLDTGVVVASSELAEQLRAARRP